MKRKLVWTLCLATFLVVSSLLVPTTVYSRSEMVKVPYGFPVPFVWQRVTQLDPPSFPQTYHVMLPQEYATYVSLLNFSINVGLGWLTIFSAVHLLRRWKARILSK